MLYYILFFALRVSSAAKQTCKIYHRQILYIIAVIVIFFFAFYRIQYYSPPLPIYALLFNSRNFFSPSCP